MTITYTPENLDYKISFGGVGFKEENTLEYYEKMLGYLKDVINSFEQGLKSKIRKTKN